MEDPPKEKPENESSSSQFTAWLGSMWDQISSWTQKDRSDSGWVILLKVLLRILVFLFLLALSPLIIIGFILAFIAAA